LPASCGSRECCRLSKREAYVLFLGLLFVLALGLHAKDKITQLKPAKTDKKALH
jgi:hypothetical protein